MGNAGLASDHLRYYMLGYDASVLYRLAGGIQAHSTRGWSSAGAK